MTPVAVLCGGLATRLGDLAEGRPKAMISVAGRPYLEHVLETFVACGLREFVLLTGFRAGVIEGHFGDGSRLGMSIRYSREPEPLGTGGAIREARGLLGARFLLTYGDVLRRFDYDRFVSGHRGNCLAVYPRIDSGNTAVEQGRVVRYAKREPELPYVDAGFGVFDSHAVIDLLPRAGGCSFEENVYPQLAGSGALEGEIVDHDFFDIGTPDQLERTRRTLGA